MPGVPGRRKPFARFAPACCARDTRPAADRRPLLLAPAAHPMPSPTLARRAARPARTLLARTLVARAALVLAAAGCRTWQPLPVGPEGAAGAVPPGLVRVTLVDGRVVAMADARVLGDSLVGRAPEASAGEEAAARRAVALREIRRVDRRRVEVLRTVGLVFSAAYIALNIAAFIDAL